MTIAEDEPAIAGTLESPAAGPSSTDPADTAEHSSSLMSKVDRIRRTAEMVGPVTTVRLLLSRVVPSGRLAPDRVAGVRAFDAEHGVETTAIVPPSDLGITGATAEHAVEYSPTAVESFAFMMDRIDIDPAEFAFVDVGCGKGLVMLLASSRPFQKIIGVEASQQLCDIARSNLDAYESSSQRCTDLEVYEGDALEFPMPDQDTVYYMCNPFGPVVLEQFFDRLEASLRAHPRRVLVVYDNPDPAYSVLERHRVLRAVERFDTVSGDYTWAWYENAIHRPADETPRTGSDGTSTGGFLDGPAVAFEPDLTPGLLRRSATTAELPFPVDHDRVAFTMNGSAALYQASVVLGLEPPDTVLCPAYNCGYEIEPFLSRGLGLDLYSVGNDLRVDIDDLRHRIGAKTKAILVTHYFGFPQPLDEIRAICDEHDLWLIEDCAHALWSSDATGAPLGTVGDVATFSMRKTVPLPNGGAVVVNTDRVQLDVDLESPPATATWNKSFDRSLMALRARRRRGSRTATAALAALLPLAVGRKVLQRLPIGGPNAWYDTDGFDFESDTEVYGWRMSDLSRRILDRVDVADVTTRRRQNFEWLVNALDTNVVTPVHTDLPDGVSPWLCPIVSDDPDQLSADLYEQGIAAPQFWLPAHPAIDWDDHPRERELKRRIIGLPIHQDVDQRQLRRIADAINCRG